jgi:hypothetical protein
LPMRWHHGSVFRNQSQSICSSLEFACS